MDLVGIIHRENAAYGISFPDVPGCVSAGDSYRDVLDMGAEALTLHLECMLEDGDVISGFRTLAELENESEFDEDFDSAELAVHYSVVFSGKAVSVTYSLDKNPLKQLKAAAE